MPLPQKYIRREHFWLEPSYANGVQTVRETLHLISLLW